MRNLTERINAANDAVNRISEVRDTKKKLQGNKKRAADVLGLIGLRSPVSLSRPEARLEALEKIPPWDRLSIESSKLPGTQKIIEGRILFDSVRVSLPAFSEDIAMFFRHGGREFLRVGDGGHRYGAHMVGTQSDFIGMHELSISTDANSDGLNVMEVNLFRPGDSEPSYVRPITAQGFEKMMHPDFEIEAALLQVLPGAIAEAFDMHLQQEYGIRNS